MCPSDSYLFGVFFCVWGGQNLECSQICLFRCCTYLDLAFATWHKGKVLKLEYGELVLPVAGELWWVPSKWFFWLWFSHLKEARVRLLKFILVLKFYNCFTLHTFIYLLLNNLNISCLLTFWLNRFSSSLKNSNIYCKKTKNPNISYFMEDQIVFPWGCYINLETLR